MSSNAASAKQATMKLRASYGLLGLVTKGAKGESVKRINDHLADSAVATASDPPRLEGRDSCDCLLATEIETGGEEDTRA